MVGAIGIEVKIHQPSSTVFRQLERYARSDKVEHLVLVTTRAKHACLPKSIHFKILDVIFLGWSFL